MLSGSMGAGLTQSCTWSSSVAISSREPTSVSCAPARQMLPPTSPDVHPRRGRQIWRQQVPYVLLHASNIKHALMSCCHQQMTLLFAADI